MEDTQIRRTAFDWLAGAAERNGGVFTRNELRQGFEYAGSRVQVIGPQGIFKPKQLTTPISITTIAGGPYADSIGGDNLLRYKYRGSDAQHPDNVGLRELMRTRRPLVYFYALMPGRYVALWPAYVVGDDPGSLTFSVAIDDNRITDIPELADGAEDGTDEGATARRKYVTALTHRRVHQVAFRERILKAYQEQCALCSLRHRELLDAAHIIPDREDGGEPVVSNGMSLCKLHHTAFDALFLSVRPDYVIEIRKDVLEEIDGPVLKHALQGLHGRPIHLPRRIAHRPDPKRLELRHQRFVEAAR